MSRILDSDELIGGNTQQALADQLTTQILSTDAVLFHDRTDPRGRRGTIERHDNLQAAAPDGVSLLVGVLGGGEAVVRTIVEQPGTIYFAPFANLFVDNTTDDSSPDSGFPGGYAFTTQHLNDLTDQGLNPRDPSNLIGGQPGDFPTLLEVAQPLVNDEMGGIREQFVRINGEDTTPSNIEDYRQATGNSLSYDQLPRSTGETLTNASFMGDPSTVIVADPDLGQNLEDEDPTNDVFPTLADINPQFEDFVVPFVQVGDYFGLELDQGAQTVEFGATFENGGGQQDITYNILNSIEGTNGKNLLFGTGNSDFISGKRGDDFLLGLNGDDLVLGGDGRDVISGGRGSDEMWGDADNDLFIYRRGFGKDAIFDLEVGEKVVVLGLSEVDDSEIVDVTLASGVTATEVRFNDTDILTIVGVQSNNLSIGDNTIMRVKAEIV